MRTGVIDPAAHQPESGWPTVFAAGPLLCEQATRSGDLTDCPVT